MFVRLWKSVDASSPFSVYQMNGVRPVPLFPSVLAGVIISLPFCHLDTSSSHLLSTSYPASTAHRFYIVLSQRPYRLVVPPLAGRYRHLPWRYNHYPIRNSGVLDLHHPQRYPEPPLPPILYMNCSLARQNPPTIAPGVLAASQTSLSIPRPRRPLNCAAFLVFALTGYVVASRPIAAELGPPMARRG